MSATPDFLFGEGRGTTEWLLYEQYIDALYKQELLYFITNMLFNIKLQKEYK